MEESVEKEIEKNAVPNLLYPELMSVGDLISVLEQRYIQNEDLSSLCKEGLVELYYRYVLPLPQRKYRMNRRGREMTKKQVIMAKKRKIAINDDNEPPKKKSSVDSNSRLISSYNISSAASDRLKPPPSCIDFTKKKISLSSKNKTEQSLTAKLENANLNNDNKEGKDTQTLRKKIIKITLDSSSTENDKSVSPDVPKKIKLNSSTCSDASEENQKSKKIKLNSPTSPNKAASFQSSVSLINKHLGGKTDLNHKEEQTTVNNKSENTKPISPTEESSKKKSKISRVSWP
ncbi:ASW [Mytilus edulis]|uniref:Ashwin n=1 Tax=Mytilus edulis TaxID=6550 RepID=A0A8S3QSW8_MYTED|nr:ASW [Mytilus edulis]